MLIIGHRGAKGLAPENTIQAIKAGYDAGAAMAEIDVRVTQDGIPVLVHDPYLNSKNIVVAKTTLLELLKIKPDLATLDQALDTIASRPVMIEIKPGVPVEPVLAKLQENALQLNTDVRIASFDFGVLQTVKSQAPDLPIVVLEKWSGVRATRRARKLGAKRIAMNQKWLWGGFIRSVARSGYLLGAYTLNDPQKATRWTKHGLSDVITDYPDRFNQSRVTEA